MNYKMIIPCSLTLLNLFAGCISIVLCFNGLLEYVYLFMTLSLVADFLDGFSARWLGAYSAIGKDLDSLADLISFGLVPSCIIYKMITAERLLMQRHGIFTINYFSLLPFIIVLFSALRLAKFNNDGEKQQMGFIGLPTPANAILILGYYYLSLGTSRGFFFLNEYIVLAICLLSSFLMVAPIPMFSFKLKTLKWKDNVYPYVLVGISLLLVCTLQKQALFFIVIAYIFLSVWRKISELTYKRWVRLDKIKQTE